MNVLEITDELNRRNHPEIYLDNEEILWHWFGLLERLEIHGYNGYRDRFNSNLITLPAKRRETTTIKFNGKIHIYSANKDGIGCSACDTHSRLVPVRSKISNNDLRICEKCKALYETRISRYNSRPYEYLRYGVFESQVKHKIASSVESTATPESFSVYLPKELRANLPGNLPLPDWLGFLLRARKLLREPKRPRRENHPPDYPTQPIKAIPPTGSFFDAHPECYLKEAKAMLEGKHWEGKNHCVKLKGD